MIIEKIYKFSKDLNTNESKIAKTIVDDLTNNKSFDKGIVALAQASGCSQPTVTRFVNQTLGLDNYKHFMLTINREVRSYFDGDYDKNNFDDNSKQIIMDIEATLANVPSESLKLATDLILKANRINVCAIGGNLTVKQEIEHKLAKIGKHVMLTPDWHHMLMNLNFMDKNDVLIVVTYSGDKKELTAIIQKAKELKIKIICITGPTNSFAKENADVIFEAKSTDAKFRAFSFTSRICVIAIWEIIFKSILSTDMVSTDVIEAWKWEQ